MALPSTGPISMLQVRNELNLSGAISLGQSAVRNLAGRSSGSISMSHLRGKSALPSPNLIFTCGRFGSADAWGWASSQSAAPPTGTLHLRTGHGADFVMFHTFAAQVHNSHAGRSYRVTLINHAPGNYMEFTTNRDKANVIFVSADGVRPHFALNRRIELYVERI